MAKKSKDELYLMADFIADKNRQRGEISNEYVGELFLGIIDNLGEGGNTGIVELPTFLKNLNDDLKNSTPSDTNNIIKYTNNGWIFAPDEVGNGNNTSSTFDEDAMWLELMYETSNSDKQINWSHLKNLSWWGQKFDNTNTGSITGNLNGVGDIIFNNNIVLKASYDSTSGYSLHVENSQGAPVNFYATGGVSALGQGTSGGSESSESSGGNLNPDNWAAFFNTIERGSTTEPFTPKYLLVSRGSGNVILLSWDTPIGTLPSGVGQGDRYLLTDSSGNISWVNVTPGEGLLWDALTSLNTLGLTETIHSSHLPALPQANNSGTLGCIRGGYTGSEGYGVNIDSNGYAYVDVPNLGSGIPKANELGKVIISDNSGNPTWAALSDLNNIKAKTLDTASLEGNDGEITIWGLPYWSQGKPTGDVDGSMTVTGNIKMKRNTTSASAVPVSPGPSHAMANADPYQLLIEGNSILSGNVSFGYTTGTETNFIKMVIKPLNPALHDDDNSNYFFYNYNNNDSIGNASLSFINGSDIGSNQKVLELTPDNLVYIPSSRTSTTTGLKIGGAILRWDESSNALKVEGSSGAVNFYATGGVSALGVPVSSTGTLSTLNVSTFTGGTVKADSYKLTHNGEDKVTISFDPANNSNKMVIDGSDINKITVNKPVIAVDGSHLESNKFSFGTRTINGTDKECYLTVGTGGELHYYMGTTPYRIIMEEITS